MNARILFWFALLVAWPFPASAHSPLPGIEGFYSGLLHPFLTADQALLMLGLGILIGGFEGHHIRRLLGVFLVATLGGLMAGPGPEGYGTLAFAAALLTGIYAAALPGRMLLIAATLVAVSGILIGMVSVPDPGPARDRMITMLGTMVGANISLLYMSALLSEARRRSGSQLLPIAYRVAASWIAAISAVMLALALNSVRSLPQGVGERPKISISQEWLATRESSDTSASQIKITPAWRSFPRSPLGSWSRQLRRDDTSGFLHLQWI